MNGQNGDKLGVTRTKKQLSSVKLSALERPRFGGCEKKQDITKRTIFHTTRIGDRRTEARGIEARGTEARGTEAMGD